MENKKINLQLFASGEETPTEVENSEVVEDETEEDVEFEDGSNEDNTKDEKVKPEPKKETTKEQKTKNYNAAKERLEKKKQDEINQAKRNAYIDGIKKSTGGINRFTEEPIKDEIDVEKFETMCEMEEKGLDPIEDYHKYVAQKRREERQAQEKEAEKKGEAQQRLDNEVREFTQKYGEETFNKILDDEDFQEFSEDLLGHLSISRIYERFLSYNAKMEEKAEKLALQKDARRKSSTGAVGKKTAKTSSILDLDEEAFNRAIREIASQY